MSWCSPLIGGCLVGVVRRTTAVRPRADVCELSRRSQKRSFRPGLWILNFTRAGSQVQLLVRPP